MGPNVLKRTLSFAHAHGSTHLGMLVQALEVASRHSPADLRLTDRLKPGIGEGEKLFEMLLLLCVEVCLNRNGTCDTGPQDAAWAGEKDGR